MWHGLKYIHLSPSRDWSSHNVVDALRALQVFNRIIGLSPLLLLHKVWLDRDSNELLCNPGSKILNPIC